MKFFLAGFSLSSMFLSVVTTGDLQTFNVVMAIVAGIGCTVLMFQDERKIQH